MPEITQGQIEEWFEKTDGPISLEKCRKELEIGVKSYSHLRTAFARMVTKGIAERVNNKDGIIRRIDRELEEIDPFNGNVEFTSLDFSPFPLNRYVRTSLPSVLVVAGASSSGKTGLLLNLAYNMCEQMDVHYFNSESGPALLRERLLGIDPTLTSSPFKIWDRMDNFSDVIVPNALNVVDYLDVDSEVYMVGNEIGKILGKLGNSGVAAIGIQKPEGRDLGYGGTFSLKKAEIYLAMDANLLRIIKAKSRAVPAFNPVGLKWTFQVGQYGTFYNVEPDGHTELLPKSERKPQVSLPWS